MFVVIHNLYKNSKGIWFFFFVLICFCPERICAQDSLTKHYKSAILSELDRSNEALRTGDLKGIYDHIYYPEDIKISFEEFMASETTVKAMKNDKIEIKKFKLISLNKVVRCGKELQCLLEQKTFMSMPTGDFSYISKMIAISENGNNWCFMNIGEKSSESVMKLAPNVCSLVFEE
ncbi:MAG: hypothetical protein ACO1G9_09190 [Bacteroidota bacterium]